MVRLCQCLLKTILLLQVFWESTGYPIIPRDPLGQKIVFTKTGPASQMVQVQSDLIGIFYLRFVFPHLLYKVMIIIFPDSTPLIPWVRKFMLMLHLR